MRGVLLTAALSCGVFFGYSFENPGSAIPLSLGDYMTQTQTGAGCSTLAGSLGASGSGVPACAGVAGDDAWYSFTATTQAAKFEVITGNFDAVMEVLTDGLASVACVNQNGANSGEVLRVNNLIEGQSYYLRVHSANGSGGNYTLCGQYYPAAFIRPTHSPNPPTDTGLPGYRLNENSARNFFGPAESLVQGTRYYLTDIDSGLEYFREFNTNISTLLLTQVPGLCFGRSYDIAVEVRVDNYWCGVSTVRQVDIEEFPTAIIQGSTLGQTFDATGTLSASYCGPDQLYEWRFTTDNGATSFTTFSTPGFSNLQLNTVECLRYNRIYTLELRVQYCGEWGPWSDPGVIFTSGIPKVNVSSNLCNTVQWPGAFITANWSPNNTAYGWQFAPVDPDDPDLVPIGPAIVVITNQFPANQIQLSSAGLEFGTTYRVGAKVFFSGGQDCGAAQESDWGFFCRITVGNPNALMPPNETRSGLLSESERDQHELRVFPNPAQSGALVTLDVSGIDYSGMGVIDIYDQTGRLVHSETHFSEAHQGLLPLRDLSGLASGYYVVSLRHEGGYSTARLVVTQ